MPVRVLVYEFVHVPMCSCQTMWPMNMKACTRVPRNINIFHLLL